MAKTWFLHGIFVYAVTPEFVQTDTTADLLEGPQGDAIRGKARLGTYSAPREVARTVVFLASKAPEFLTNINDASYLR